MKHYDIIDIFGSDSTIKKLFNNSVMINFKQHLVIPCLIAIMNPIFNITKFEFTDDKGKLMKNLTMYALVKLDIPCELDYDDFLNGMSTYKLLANTVKYYKSNKYTNIDMTKKSSEKYIKQKTKTSKKANKKTSKKANKKTSKLL